MFLSVRENRRIPGGGDYHFPESFHSMTLQKHFVICSLLLTVAGSFSAIGAVAVLRNRSQDGFDHVDGHRSICLVASPYTRRGALGLPAMNQMNASAPLMRDCFTAKPNIQPYTCC